MPLGWIAMVLSWPGGKPSCVTLVTPKIAPYWVMLDRSISMPGIGSVTAPCMKIAPYWVMLDRSISMPGIGSVTAPCALEVAGTSNDTRSKGSVASSGLIGALPSDGKVKLLMGSGSPLPSGLTVTPLAAAYTDQVSGADF